MLDAVSQRHLIAATAVVLIAVCLVGILKGQTFNPLFIRRDEAATPGATVPSAGEAQASGQSRTTRQALDAEADTRGLSDRERTILEMICAGQSVKEISEALFLSPSGTRAHLSRIYKKFGVHSHDELMGAIGRVG